MSHIYTHKLQLFCNFTGIDIMKRPLCRSRQMTSWGVKTKKKLCLPLEINVLYYKHKLYILSAWQQTKRTHRKALLRLCSVAYSAPGLIGSVESISWRVLTIRCLQSELSCVTHWSPVRPNTPLACSPTWGHEWVHSACADACSTFLWTSCCWGKTAAV